MLALSFYTQFFDVDTNEVLRRCWAALYPRAPFLDVIDGNPDLYGPFWIATTVVFILFLAGTLNLRMGGPTDDGFNWGLLSGASGLIYGYTGVIPIGLWATLRWFGSESANLLECWCLYGYANIVWIVVAAISWSRIDSMFKSLLLMAKSLILAVLNFIFVALGFAVSAVFLVRNLYPVLSATDIKTSKILLIVMVVLHAGLAIAIKVLFFAHGSPVAKTPPTNEAPTPLDPPPTEGGSRFML